VFVIELLPERSSALTPMMLVPGTSVTAADQLVVPVMVTNIRAHSNQNLGNTRQIGGLAGNVQTAREKRG